MLANGLFLSKLAYGMPVWGGCEDYLVRSLQIVQKRLLDWFAGKGYLHIYKVTVKGV